MQTLSEHFDPLIGRPSWSVERGRESLLFADRPSMVFLEFGEPVLTIDRPRLWPVHIEGAPARTLGRLTFLRGTWHLTLLACDWRLTLDGHLLATSGSAGAVVDAALDVLCGQALVAVDVGPDDTTTVFRFDLGCVLTTTRGAGADPAGPRDLWVLTTASTSYLELRDDGLFRHRPIGVRASDEDWRPVHHDGPETVRGRF